MTDRWQKYFRTQSGMIVAALEAYESSRSRGILTGDEAGQQLYEAIRHTLLSVNQEMRRDEEEKAQIRSKVDPNPNDLRDQLRASLALEKARKAPNVIPWRPSK